VFAITFWEQSLNAQVWEKDFAQGGIPTPQINDASISHSITTGINANTIVVVSGEQDKESNIGAGNTFLKYVLTIREYSSITGLEIKNKYFDYPGTIYDKSLVQFIPTKIVTKSNNSGYYVLAYIMGNTPLSRSSTNVITHCRHGNPKLFYT